MTVKKYIIISAYGVQNGNVHNLFVHYRLALCGMLDTRLRILPGVSINQIPLIFRINR